MNAGKHKESRFRLYRWIQSQREEDEDYADVKSSLPAHTSLCYACHGVAWKDCAVCDGTFSILWFFIENDEGLCIDCLSYRKGMVTSDGELWCKSCWTDVHAKLCGCNAWLKERG